MSYPDESAKEKVPKSSRRGSFQMLRMRIALAFDKNKRKHVETLCAKNQGIFVWQDLHMQKLHRLKWKDESLIAKQLHMIAYSVELFYDLCIDVDDNISESAGFETPLGIFGSQAL